MKYKSMVATERGGPECLQIVENDLRSPAAGEVLIRTQAAHVSLPDVQARRGQSPFKPKVPFTPGYAIVGTVEAIGKDVVGVTKGDIVGVLTVYGGYTEYLNWDSTELISIPYKLDPAEAVCLILNYIVAYQTMHRSAKVQAGEKILIIGASGGIGTAILQLGVLADLKMYGMASPSKHHVLREYGAEPIDYHTQDFIEVLQRMEPEGIDVVFDGMGGDYFTHGFSLLRRGGRLVGYGNPLNLSQMIRSLIRMVIFTVTPNGRSAKLYGTGAIRLHREPFLEDWSVLFQLLRDRKIQPLIAERFPILEAQRANELLESGQVIGNVVLVAPELLDARGFS